MNERILLMDDDTNYVAAFSRYLATHGYQVSTAPDARDVEMRLQRDAPDLVLLEQCMGGMTGTAVLRRIRTVSGVPVIILTRRSEQIERIINLESGADDEVHKSVTRRETLARMRAVLRRSHAGQVSRPGGWMVLDSQRDVIRPDGLPCQLTTAEFGVLRWLMAAKGEPVSRMQLSQHVFGRPLSPGDRAVDTVIYKLRSKLGAMVIVTVRPVGYAFAGFGDARAAE
jgi:DNA-binding response OmpR family regulator